MAHKKYIGLVGGSDRVKSTIKELFDNYTHEDLIDVVKDGLVLIPLRTHNKTVEINDHVHYAEFVHQLLGPFIDFDTTRRIAIVDDDIVFVDIQRPIEGRFIRDELGGVLIRIIQRKSDNNGDSSWYPWDVDTKDGIGCHISLYEDRYDGSDDLKYIIERILSTMRVKNIDTDILESNYCLECGVDMGSCNPRQLCGKSRCPSKDVFI